MTEPIDNRVFVLILRHPQERREALATAPLVCATLRQAKLAIGLSWPGLGRLVGEPAEPRRWAVLHLGAARPEAAVRRELSVLDRSGAVINDPAAILRGLRGIVLLDGSWSQAKTLWWRNPWLLKLHRIVLDPPRGALDDRSRGAGAAPPRIGATGRRRADRRARRHDRRGAATGAERAR